MKTVAPKRYNAVSMPAVATMNTDKVLGKAPERLTFEEQDALSGKFIALEIYTPQTLPLRRIEAAGETPAACLAQLAARGLDPAKFELQLYKATL